MQMDIEKFNPTLSELNGMVEKSKLVTVTDIDDKAQMEVVKKTRIELKGMRVAIKKTGKEMRDDANKFAKSVIAKEKELVGIIEPEELRLSSLEDEVKDKIIRKARLELLPIRKIQLEAIGDNIEVTDEELLSMDNDKFNEHYSVRLEVKKDEEASKEREEAEKVEREKEMKEREEKAKIEERERIEREAKEKEEAEAKEKEKLAKMEKYQTWLKENEYKEEDHKIVDKGETVELYKLVATFTK